MIDNIEGNLIFSGVDSEPWEYSITRTEKEVTGGLREAVLKRLGRSKGRVTSWEKSSSFGTCEICGSESDSIEIRVDGEVVYEGEEGGGLGESYPSPFVKLQEWLDGE